MTKTVLVKDKKTGKISRATATDGPAELIFIEIWSGIPMTESEVDKLVEACNTFQAALGRD